MNKSMSPIYGGLFLLLALLQGAANARAASSHYARLDEQNVTSVDLRDLVEFRKDVPEAKIILNSIQKKPELYFPKGVTFDMRGAGASLDKHRLNCVYGIEFSEKPKRESGKRVRADLVAFLHTSNKEFFFRKFRVTLNLDRQEVDSVKHLDDISSEKTSFTVTIGLVHRKLILKDEKNGITKVYPLGVGAIDEGVRYGSIAKRKTVSMTPQFRNAKLDREFMYLSKPGLTYKGMPLLPITPGSATAPAEEAFHIIQHPKLINKAKNLFDLNFMIRGFDSHGCMRIREKDLYELYAIAKFGAERLTPVNIYNWVPKLPDHPYPLNEEYYKAVANHGTKANPTIGVDSSGYTDLTKKMGKPPVETLEELEIE